MSFQDYQFNFFNYDDVSDSSLDEYSDSNNRGFDITWGDAGIANFFIRQSALKNLDFTDVLYNWDCS